MRIEQCGSCGGHIVATAEDPDGFAAVRFHYRSEQHRAWEANKPRQRPDRRGMALAYIAAYRRAHAYGPTVREVGEAIGLSGPSPTHYILRSLRDAGLVDWDDGPNGRGIPRSLRIVEEAA